MTPVPMCVASTHSDRQPGGLSTVVERVVGLTRSDYDWTWLVRLDRPGGGATDYASPSREGRRAGPGAEVRTVAALPLTAGLRRNAGRALFRPGGMRVVPSLYGATLRRSLNRQFPSGAKHIHWVGTGIELTGFELLRRARRDGIPFTVWPALHPHEWGDAEIDARLYRAADRVLALSPSERGHLRAMGVDSERIAVVPLGPTVCNGGDGERWRHKHRVARQDLVVTFMARRSKHKGLPAVLEAARRLQQEGLAFVLAVAGPPGDVEEVTRAPWIVDLGLCSEPEKADLLAATNVFCVPSTSESLGIVYLDAWSAGLPVVAGRAPAVRDLVEHGVDGFCVSQEVSEVQTTLRSLLTDEDARRTVGRAGRRKQQARYTWAACAEEHRAIFRQAALDPKHDGPRRV